MCGRFVISKAGSSLLPDLLGHPAEIKPDFNVAPTRQVAAVRQWEGERVMPLVHWGYVPGWAKDFKKQRPQPINARLETVATSPMFRKSFASHRGVIPADGYFEWTVTETGKQPHFIYEPGAGLAMAAIISAWADPAKDEDDPDKWRLSAAIITRDSHVAPGEVHDRMPALLSPDAYDDWLGDHLGPDELLQLLERESHAAAHGLEHYEVSRDVNNVRNNGEQLLERLA
jgi:putative SOS response-associated peptidase YedK